MQNKNQLILVFSAFLSVWSTACADGAKEEIGHPNPWDSVEIDSNLPDGTESGSPVDTETSGQDSESGDVDTAPGEKPEPMDGPKIAYTFDESDDGFLGRYFSQNPDNGAIELDVVFEGSLIEEGVILRKDFTAADMTGATHLQALVRTPEFVTGGKQIFIMTGSSWSWCGNWTNHVENGAWEMITLDLLSCSNTDLSYMRTIGIQVAAGAGAPSSQVVHMVIDAFYIIGIDEIPIPSEDTESDVDAGTAEDTE